MQSQYSKRKILKYALLSFLCSLIALYSSFLNNSTIKIADTTLIDKPLESFEISENDRHHKTLHIQLSNDIENYIVDRFSYSTKITESIKKDCPTQIWIINEEANNPEIVQIIQNQKLIMSINHYNKSHAQNGFMAQLIFGLFTIGWIYLTVVYIRKPSEKPIVSNIN